MTNCYKKGYADGGEIKPLSANLADAAGLPDDGSFDTAEMRKLKRQNDADKSPTKKRDGAPVAKEAVQGGFGGGFSAGFKNAGGMAGYVNGGLVGASTAQAHQSAGATGLTFPGGAASKGNTLGGGPASTGVSYKK